MDKIERWLVCLSCKDYFPIKTNVNHKEIKKNFNAFHHKHPLTIMSNNELNKFLNDKEIRKALAKNNLTHDEKMNLMNQLRGLK